MSSTYTQIKSKLPELSVRALKALMRGLNVAQATHFRPIGTKDSLILQLVSYLNWLAYNQHHQTLLAFHRWISNHTGAHPQSLTMDSPPLEFGSSSSSSSPSSSSSFSPFPSNPSLSSTPSSHHSIEANTLLPAIPPPSSSSPSSTPSVQQDIPSRSNYASSPVLPQIPPSMILTTATSPSIPSSLSSSSAPPIPNPQPLPSPLTHITKNEYSFPSFPFWAFGPRVSNFVLCKQFPQDKKGSITIPFTLTEAYCTTLKNLNPLPHTTPSLFFACGDPTLAKRKPGSTNTLLIPLEYPYHCGVTVNKQPLRSMNLRGIRNKPGTTRPGDITHSTHLQPGVENILTMAYVNLSKPLIGAIYMGEVYSVQSVINQLNRDFRLSASHILEEMRRRWKMAKEEDEILATRLSLSLKCPLGFNRIRIPVRSRVCQHPQCWDALNFLELNLQTPTWQCPHCERFLPERSLSDLFIDGYFASILDSTPESMDNVVISEEDGSILDPPFFQNPSIPLSSSSPLSLESKRISSPVGTKTKGRKGQRSSSPYERSPLLDHRDRPEEVHSYVSGTPLGRSRTPIITTITTPSGPSLARTSNPAHPIPSSSSSSSTSSPPIVIDLTLSSDDEDEAMASRKGEGLKTEKEDQKKPLPSLQGSSTMDSLHSPSSASYPTTQLPLATATITSSPSSYSSSSSYAYSPPSSSSFPPSIPSQEYSTMLSPMATTIPKALSCPQPIHTTLSPHPSLASGYYESFTTAHSAHRPDSSGYLSHAPSHPMSPAIDYRTNSSSHTMALSYPMTHGGSDSAGMYNSRPMEYDRGTPGEDPRSNPWTPTPNTSYPSSSYVYPTSKEGHYFNHRPE
ncbi:MAG: hypothetical protein DHS80DRAFT_31472 [Piptocephalis tieghemiana]|nr:MAG: hypothetical protein DHS80DRAFT_31472 [Piptocephalis tieghemiana]